MDIYFYPVDISMIFPYYGSVHDNLPWFKPLVHRSWGLTLAGAGAGAGRRFLGAHQSGRRLLRALGRGGCLRHRRRGENRRARHGVLNWDDMDTMPQDLTDDLTIGKP